MDPVEINAGACYLRALPANSRIDDRPALLELGETDPNYVGLSAARCSSDAGYSWAVCEPTTGKLLAEVTLDPTTGDIGTRAMPASRWPPARRCGGSARRSVSPETWPQTGPHHTRGV